MKLNLIERICLVAIAVLFVGSLLFCSGPRHKPWPARPDFVSQLELAFAITLEDPCQSPLRIQYNYENKVWEVTCEDCQIGRFEDYWPLVDKTIPHGAFVQHSIETRTTRFDYKDIFDSQCPEAP